MLKIIRQINDKDNLFTQEDKNWYEGDFLKATLEKLRKEDPKRYEKASNTISEYFEKFVDEDFGNIPEDKKETQLKNIAENINTSYLGIYPALDEEEFPEFEGEPFYIVYDPRTRDLVLLLRSQFATTARHLWSEEMSEKFSKDPKEQLKLSAPTKNQLEAQKEYYFDQWLKNADWEIMDPIDDKIFKEHDAEIKEMNKKFEEEHKEEIQKLFNKLLERTMIAKEEYREPGVDYVEKAYDTLDEKELLSIFERAVNRVADKYNHFDVVEKFVNQFRKESARPVYASNKEVKSVESLSNEKDDNFGSITYKFDIEKTKSLMTPEQLELINRYCEELNEDPDQFIKTLKIKLSKQGGRKITEKEITEHADRIRKGEILLDSINDYKKPDWLDDDLISEIIEDLYPTTIEEIADRIVLMGLKSKEDAIRYVKIYLKKNPKEWDKID